MFACLYGGGSSTMFPCLYGGGSSTTVITSGGRTNKYTSIHRYTIPAIIIILYIIYHYFTLYCVNAGGRCHVEVPHQRWGLGDSEKHHPWVLPRPGGWTGIAGRGSVSGHRRHPGNACESYNRNYSNFSITCIILMYYIYIHTHILCLGIVDLQGPHVNMLFQQKLCQFPNHIYYIGVYNIYICVCVYLDRGPHG